MKKHWSFLLGASVLGVAGSLLFKNKRKQVQADTDTLDLYKLYQGDWWFVDQQKATQHTLTISDTLQVILDKRKLQVALIELNMNRLVVQDNYGYHLILQRHGAQAFSLYDEADDQTYPLEPITTSG